jgi:hypothetical protein
MLMTFVLLGPNETECWKASQRVPSGLASLGIQDAARKRREASLEAGAWKGSVVHTSEGEVVVLATMEKWTKLKECIAWMWNHHEDVDGMDHSLLESKRGFLVHMGQTYPALKPYMKGVHATLESWRQGRDNDGWAEKNTGSSKEGPTGDGSSGQAKASGSSRKAKARANKRKRGAKGSESSAERIPDWDMEDPISWEEKFGNFNLSRFGEDGRSAPPPKVRPVRRLKEDLRAMHELTDYDEPPRRRVRLGKFARAIYGFGDASKDGFGASIDIVGKGVVWRSGVWNLSIREEFVDPRGIIEFSRV